MSDKKTGKKKDAETHGGTESLRIPLSQRICRSLDLPAGTIGKSSFVEITGGQELTADRCEALVKYSSDTIILEMCDGFLTIKGGLLEIRSFSGGCAVISGRIASVILGRVTQTEESNETD